jgi:hypothetical protein
VMYDGTAYETGGGVPILDTTELGLGESLQLSEVGRGTGMLRGGTEDSCRGIETALRCDGTAELVEGSVLQVILRSSIAVREGTAENWSYAMSGGPPSVIMTSASETPRSCRSSRSFLFSSTTLRAAIWISEEASMPTCSQPRSLASNSCRYSLRRARERPEEHMSAKMSQTNM